MTSTTADRGWRGRAAGLLGRWRERLAGLSTWQRVLLITAVIVIVLALLSLSSVAIAYRSVYTAASIPSPDELEPPEPTVMLDRDGKRVATLEPAELRRNVDIDDLPDHVPDAVLAAEDRRFYQHGGFSLPAIARAAVANLRSGEIQQGASTIHQQYVSLAIADIEHGYVDKFREATMAARLNDEVDKDTVLQMYLNTVPFGRTAQGIEAAARTYFDVSADELDVEQAALLAGMIAAPSAYDPGDHPEAAAARRDFVLQGMVEMGNLDADEAEELIGSELPELRDRPLVSFDEDAFFLETVRNQVGSILEGEQRDPSTGLVIHTTLDQQAQQLAVAELRDHLDGYPYQGAVTTLDSDSGAVRALVGGRDFSDSQYNVAVSGERQPGSAFKTFTLTELVAQGYHPDATRIHAPREYEIEVDGGEDTTVGNYGDRGHGEVSARQATVDSINTAYIQLIEELGPDRVAELARDMGIESELHEYPSLTLGTAEVMPLELTVAYATLAAEGTRHTPFMIERIEEHEGGVVYEHEPEAEEVLEPEVANVVTDVLVDVVERGTGTAADLDRPIAGKTGTTDDYADAWFVGYTPQRTTGVWVGNLDNSPMEDEISGGSLPAQIWGAFMAEYVEDDEVEEFPEPDTSGLRELTGLERPEPEPAPEPAPEPREPEDAREDEEEDDEKDEDEDGDDDEGENTEDSDDTEDGEDGELEDALPGDDSTDDGSTDDGSTDDGSTDDSTDDGSTDDSTDDGSTDDGSTADGSTDDSTTDSTTSDGSTDDSTTDSTTDDGSTDDSTTDSTTDDGSTTDG